MSNHHLTFVLAPITATISRAKKTRELWAASFVFSRWMYHLLKAAEDMERPDALPFTAIISPEFDAQKAHAYGAGMYHDRGFLKLSAEPTPAQITSWEDTAMKSLADDLKTDAETLRPHLQLQIALQEATEKDTPPILALNKLLDNLELRPLYQPVEAEKSLINLLDEGIHELYEAGYEKGKGLVFLTLPNGDPRLPSLPEIALREIKEHENESVQEVYKKLVTNPTDYLVELLKKNKVRSKDLPATLRKKLAGKPYSERALKKLEDSQRMNELLYTNLKRELPDGTLKFRHRYYAFVQLDGDGLGSHLRSIEDKGGDFVAFSKSLLRYAEEAVKLVIDYGGTPIFSGGDDLLFLAPVAVPYQPEKKAEDVTMLTNVQDQQTNEDGELGKKNIVPSPPTDVLGLCLKLDDLFRTTVNENLRLSGGVFVGYYKFPLGEAKLAAKRLEETAKKFKIWTKAQLAVRDESKRRPLHEKNALSLEVRKHSGQTFGTTFHLGAPSFQLLVNLLAFDQKRKEGPAIDNNFLTAAMHRLQSIPSLLADVSRHGNEARRDAFKKHQFGKGGPKHEGEFLKDTLKLSHALFQEYGEALDPKEEKAILKKLEREGRSADPFDEAIAQRLFAALRFKQFLIQDDHE